MLNTSRVRTGASYSVLLLDIEQQQQESLSFTSNPLHQAESFNNIDTDNIPSNNNRFSCHWNNSRPTARLLIIVTIIIVTLALLAVIGWRRNPCAVSGQQD